jgi:hypothetical protein
MPIVLATNSGSHRFEVVLVWRPREWVALSPDTHATVDALTLLWVPETLAAGFRKFWPRDLMLQVRSGRQARGVGAHRRAVQREEPSPLEDAIEDGLQKMRPR